MVKFKVESYSDFLKITNSNGSLKMSVYLKNPDDSTGVIFETPFCKFVTCRDLRDYDREIKEHKINPNFKYVEIGAGLGEFIPNLIDRYGSKLKYKPIVIDPINYSLIRDIINFTLSLDLTKKVSGRLKIILMRCLIILDNNKVILINIDLEQAVKSKKILNIADVLIDMAGAAHYMKNYKYAWKLERRILKPNGILLATVIKSGIHYPS